MGVVQEFVQQQTGNGIILENKSKKLRRLGAFLLIVSGLLAFVWFYWLTPVKHLVSTPWIKTHSKEAWWIEDQKSVGRVGVMHDVGIEVGEWGDEHWAAWIIRHIKPGQDISSCEAGHLGQALANITNHQLNPEADIWIAWWQTNQNKSQIEWIKEGFAEQGVMLENPLTTNNIIDLLKLANQPTNSPVYTNHFAQSIRMNAFRWLRDSGVNYKAALEIWNYDVDSIPSEDRRQITLALLFYADWYGQNWDGPGKLPLRNNSDWFIPHEHETTFDHIRKYFDFGIPLLALVGIWLLRRPMPK